jgi:hypothetical protein
MTPAAARIWIIKSSIVAYGCAFVFFVLAPALGYPLSYSDAINVMKVIVPIFAGYLGIGRLVRGGGRHFHRRRTGGQNALAASQMAHFRLRGLHGRSSGQFSPFE